MLPLLKRLTNRPRQGQRVQRAATNLHLFENRLQLVAVVPHRFQLFMQSLDGLLQTLLFAFTYSLPLTLADPARFFESQSPACPALASCAVCCKPLSVNSIGRHLAP